MTTTYRWKPGSRVNVDPEIAGQVLSRIEAGSNGGMVAEAILAEAQARTSPLHPHFEWDNKKAAHAHRLEQANYLIRSIEKIEVTPEGDGPPVRAFVSVVQEERRSFVSTERALCDTELRAQVLAQAWRDFDALRRRHAELTEFANLFSAIDQARPA